MALREKNRNNKKRSIIYIIILVLGIAAVFWFFGKNLFKKEEPPVAETKKEEVFVLRQTNVSEELEFFGSIEANRESRLSAKTSGRISAVNVDEGDQVKKGQLLAYLYPDQNAIDFRKRNEIYANFEKFRLEQQQFLDRQVRIAQRNLDVKKEEEDFAEEFDPNREDIAEDEVDLAEAVLSSTKQDRDAQRKSLQEQSSSLRGDKDIAGQNVADTRITSPFDGVVTQKIQEAGEVVNVSVGDLVVVVADVSKYKVVVEVIDTLIERLSVGLKARVIIDGISGEHSATVTKIMPQANRLAKKIEVEVTLDSIPQNVKVDMFTRVFIKFPPRTAYFVPNNFILSGYEGPFIMLENKKVQPIERGVDKDGMTEIKFDGISDNINILRN